MIGYYVRLPKGLFNRIQKNAVDSRKAWDVESFVISACEFYLRKKT